MKFLRALIGAGCVALAFGACSDSGGVAGSGGTGGGADGGGNAGSGGLTPQCSGNETKCDGNVPQTCGLNGQWQNGAPCPFVCNAGVCGGSCAPGSTRCKLGGEQKCGADGEWEIAASPCEYGCEAGKCRTSCNPGEYNCYGNEIQQCNGGTWASTGTTCNAQSGQACDAATGTCTTLSPIGSTTPTGQYFQYAIFQTDATAFLGGYDVDAYGDLLYVNRGSQYMDVYKIVLHDTDGDGKLEPDQHPDNPNATGPIEERTLEFVATYQKSVDGVPMGTASKAEIYALEDRIFALGPNTPSQGVITEYILGTKTTTTVVQPASTYSMSFMGYGDVDKTWYAGNESNRRVYSFHAPTNSWVAEFEYPNLAGSHMDGMELVVAPKTGDQYVYVTDMTSDFIGQYIRTEDGWKQEALYEYADSTSSPIEGFGFGALNHFWAASGSYLYEIGGGDIQEFLEPCEGGKQACGGETDDQCPPTFTCLNGCCESVN